MTCFWKRRPAREPAKPTIKLPAGAQFPTTRQRLMALLIDLGVLLFLVIVASFIVAPAVDRSLHQPIVDRIDVLRKDVDNKTTQADKLDKTASDVAKKNGKDSDAAKAAKNTADDYRKNELKNATDAYDKEARKLAPLNTTITAAALLIGLLYLALPSGRAGQTVGKRLQGIRVVRVDGSPLGFGGAFRRYGLILLATFLLTFALPLGPIGAALVLFGVTMWTRNPNHQGMHDRIVKTIVVNADET